MANETKTSETVTENIFRLFYGSNTFIEKSAIPNECGFITKHSKNKRYFGYPDFFREEDLYAIVVEVKANDFASAKKEVQYYMENNSINKDIIGIALSGQSDDTLDVCYFLKLKDEKHPKQIQTDNALLSIENIQKAYKAAKHIEITSEENLVKTLRSLNVQFHNENIVRDTERSLFFSGLMIALKDSTFRSTYRQMQKPSIEEAKQGNLCEAHLLNEAIVTAITRQLETKINNLSKEYNWKDKFSFIKTIVSASKVQTDDSNY